jgi:hypothetical protein
VLGPQTDVHVQDLQNLGAFVDGSGGVGADHRDGGTALRERVSGREPADT